MTFLTTIPAGAGDVDDGEDRRLVDEVGALLDSGVGPRGRLGVAFSGGVDSSLLLALAVRHLGPERVVAVLGISPSLAADERAAAHDVAAYEADPGTLVVPRAGEVLFRLR